MCRQQTSQQHCRSVSSPLLEHTVDNNDEIISNNQCTFLFNFAPYTDFFKWLSEKDLEKVLGMTSFVVKQVVVELPAMVHVRHRLAAMRNTRAGIHRGAGCRETEQLVMFCSPEWSCQHQSNHIGMQSRRLALCAMDLQLKPEGIIVHWQRHPGSARWSIQRIFPFRPSRAPMLSNQL